MNYRLLTTLVALGAIFVAHDALAAFTSARATPRQVQINANSGGTLSINWQVQTTTDHTTGAFSPDALIIDPATRATLSAIPRTFNVVGAGPFSFREVITLDPDLVRAWIDRGSTRLVLQRTFGDAAGNSTSATVILTLSRSKLQATRRGAQDVFGVNALRLEFDTGNNTKVATADEEMRAALTVSYNGTGLLQGRWQIAEPGSSEGRPLYRTLAIVNTNLRAGQRSTLRSPALPTNRPGKYLLRFCVTNRFGADPGGDTQCPNPTLVAHASYQVQGSIAGDVRRIAGMSPDRQSVSAQTPFRWEPLAGARIYQLQIFTLGAADADLLSSRAESDPVAPEFVGGMLLKAATTNTPLSESARNKLVPGHRYLWRVTAHDESGRMIGMSAESSFVYEPSN